MKIKLNKGLLLIPAMIVFAESQAQTVTSSKEPGINVSFFDNTVKPQIIFRFVNGTWLDKTEIPVIELHGKF
jgi:endothelin-converting enzyme/putative endopeptidase